MAIPTLTPRAFYALRTDIIGNAHYVSDDEILYAGGGLLIVHNYTEIKQRYIKLIERSHFMKTIIMSPNRTMAAIIENGEKAQIVIFDMQTLKKKRTLTLPPDAQTNKFESICFSHDERYVLAVTGDPDWMMYCYNWEKGKIETLTRANYQNNPTPVFQVLCSPTDSSVVVLIGQGLFRLMNMQETVWRQYGFQKADQLVVTSAVFLNNDRVLAGTQDGKILLVDNAELRAIYDASTVTVMNAREKEETTATGMSSSSLLIHRIEDIESEDALIDKSVVGLIALEKGFAYACKPGRVHLFEKESNFKYRKRNLFVIEEVDYREEQTDCLNQVKHLSVNVSQDRLLATTNKSQIYVVRLWGPDIQIAPEIPFTHLGESLHHGPIKGLAMCTWKPIFMTCGEIDRTVRVWNYETQSLDLVKQYQEDVYSVALHPTGLFAAIGFADKLRFMLVLIDDIQPCREFPIRECCLTSFSTFGHFFASVNNNTIHVFSSISFQSVYVFKGHNGPVKGLVWTPDDKKLISCGADGAIYEWDLNIGKRVKEIVTKTVSFWGTAVSSDGKFIFAVGNDGLLKEIKESTILRVFDVQKSDLNNIILSRSDLMMFLSSDDGDVISMKIPLTEPPEYSVFHFHNSRIHMMKLSYDDQTLVTISQKGALGIWRLSFAEGKTALLEKDFQYSNEILISRQDLEEKILSIKDLSQRMHELEMEHAYQMRQIESANVDKIRDIHETYSQAIDELKEKNEQLENEHSAELQNINSDVNKLKEKHETTVQQIETNYNAKLIVEYDKYIKLEQEFERMTNDFENKLAELLESKNVSLADLKTEYESKLINLYAQLEESYEEIKKQQKEHEEIKQQIEDDADREIVELKTKYESMLKDEKESNTRLKGETGVMKKKYVTAQKEIEEYQRQINDLLTDHQKFQTVIRNLEKDILDLKKEISERDLTIQDKEKRIYDLKRKNQELEKFKFVLNYKIKELKNQIDPRDREIREKKELIGEMELELENLQKVNMNLDLQLFELREKLQATDIEIQRSREKYTATSNKLRHIKTDVFSLSSNIQDIKALKDGIKKICFKYAQDEEFVRGRRDEDDLKSEFMRQREFLEQTISSLKSTLQKYRDKKQENATKVMEDNVVLIQEINTLRKELKQAKQKSDEMESLICLKSRKSMSPKEAHNRLQQVLKTQSDIRKECQDKVDQAELKVELLKDEIQRLVDRINEQELEKIDETIETDENVGLDDKDKIERLVHVISDQKVDEQE